VNQYSVHNQYDAERVIESIQSTLQPVKQQLTEVLSDGQEVIAGYQTADPFLDRTPGLPTSDREVR